MASSTERVVTVDGFRWQISELGDGPPVVLCHGFPGLGYSYRHQMRALAASGYRAIAPDMPGYGGTDVPRDIDDYTTYATDIGGPAALVLQRLPEDEREALRTKLGAAFAPFAAAAGYELPGVALCAVAD